MANQTNQLTVADLEAAKKTMCLISRNNSPYMRSPICDPEKFKSANIAATCIGIVEEMVKCAKPKGDAHTMSLENGGIAMPDKNALAKLVERLASNEVRFVEGDEFPIHLSKNAICDFRKARRIVAEVAKYNIGLIPQPEECFGCEVLKALAGCRKIAEE